jgi:biotin synthase
MNLTIQTLAERVLAGDLLTPQQAKELLAASLDDLDDLLYWANQIRRHFFGTQVRVCSIVPGRLGGCNQDCAFCAQSVRYDTGIDKTPKVLSDEQILAAAAEAKRKGVPNFGIVYSGKAVSDSELERLIALAGRLKNEYGLGVCMGLGILSDRQMFRLAQAGVVRYNHNLETSRRHFPEIVTTHSYEDRVRTIEAAAAAGLGVCAGGIFGIGEREQDRLDMAFELRRLGVDTVPMNFLHPIAGTPLEKAETLQPRDILRIIALYRFILPTAHLKVAGGRVLNLRDLQSWIFFAGCTSILSGNYLTTAGRSVEEDMRMLRDLGLTPVAEVLTKEQNANALHPQGVVP